MRNIREFFQYFDKYAQVVSLTYKKSGKHQTVAGGVCTVFVFIILAYWIIINLFFTFYENGSFITSNGKMLTQKDDGSFPLYEIGMDQLFIAFKILTLLPYIDNDIERYIQGVWVQSKPDHSFEYFLPVPCLEVFGQDDRVLNPQFKDQIHDMQCADMKGDSIKLQDNGSHKYEEYAGYSWYFLLDTCEELSHVTGKTDCVPAEIVRQVFNEFSVTTKTVSQFFSEKTYINNNHQLNASFEIERFMLSTLQANQIRYNIMRVTNDFSNDVLYNDQFRMEAGWGTKRIETYDTIPGFAKTLPYSDMVYEKYQKTDNTLFLGAPLSIHLQQHYSERYYSATRSTIYELLRGLGSYIAFFNLTAAYFLGTYQRHSLQASMIKKLYSAGKEKEPEPTSHNSQSPSHGGDSMSSKSSFKTTEEEEESQEDRLKSAITNRQIFSYGYWRNFTITFFSHAICCCCRVQHRRQDRLQESAKTKLYSEIDILEIIKKLRVAYFASELTLKPRQRWLVSFFHEYKLESASGDSSDSELRSKTIQRGKSVQNILNNRRATIIGAETSAYGNVDDLINKKEEDVTRVLQAVNRVDITDEKDAIIADRIQNTSNFSQKKQSNIFIGTGIHMNHFISEMESVSLRHQSTLPAPGAGSSLQAPLLEQRALEQQPNDIFKYAELKDLGLSKNNNSTKLGAMLVPPPAVRKRQFLSENL